MPVAVPPAREIARAIADDGVGGEGVAHDLDARAEVELDRCSVSIGTRLGLAPLQPFAVRVAAGRKAHQVGIAPLGGHLAKFAHVGADRQIGVIDAAKLVGVGVDVDKQLVGMVGGD